MSSLIYFSVVVVTSGGKQSCGKVFLKFSPMDYNVVLKTRNKCGKKMCASKDGLHLYITVLHERTIVFN